MDTRRNLFFLIELHVALESMAKQGTQHDAEEKQTKQKRGRNGPKLGTQKKQIRIKETRRP